MSEALDLEQFAGHTPGPWQSLDRHDGGKWLRSSVSGLSVAHEIEVALEPDRRLLAAAPALLTEVESSRERIALLEGLLREARKELSGPFKGCDCPVCTLAPRIDAALAGGEK